MKYFVIDIETYLDGSPLAKSLYEYDTETDAVASFHSRTGSAMKNQKVATVLCEAFDEEGTSYEHKFWRRTVVGDAE